MMTHNCEVCGKATLLKNTNEIYVERKFLNICPSCHIEWTKLRTKTLKSWLSRKRKFIQDDKTS